MERSGFSSKPISKIAMRPLACEREAKACNSHMFKEYMVILEIMLKEVLQPSLEKNSVQKRKQV